MVHGKQNDAILTTFRFSLRFLKRIPAFKQHHSKKQTGAKILNLSKNSHFESLIFDKIHIFKASILAKFTISKSHFSQNSQFQCLIFHKIHIFQTSNSG